MHQHILLAQPSKYIQKPTFTISPAVTLFWTTIIFHLDYCNSMLTGFLQLITPLQCSLNKADRLMLYLKNMREKERDWIGSYVTQCKCQRTQLGQKAPAWSSFWLLPRLHLLLHVPLLNMLFLHWLPLLFLQHARHSCCLRAFALAILPDWKARLPNTAWLALSPSLHLC